MDTKKGDNNTGGVISYVGPCGGTPSRTSPISMCSKNSNSLSCFSSSSSSSSTHTPPFRSGSSSSSGSAGEDGSSSAGGSPQGSDDGGSFRALTSKSVASLTKLGGMMLLCKVCGDGASGFHYGVHACEGCKGFFRRSIQQNIQYKKCVQNESCSILRVNRNRCQQCRFKKCLSVGMSRDAVRFGRIPKREKQRMLAEMQSAMNNMNTSLSSTCPRVTITPYPQPSALPHTPSAPSPPASPPTLPLPPFPYQSPSHSSPLTPSPGLDSTISAIARAHRETFLYAHDKLANPQVPPQQNNHAHQNMGAEPWGPNRCPSGSHSDGQNTIYHYNNNLLSENRRNKTHNHYGNGRRNLDSSNLIIGDDHVTQGQNCAMKKHRGIMLACPMNMQPHTDGSKTPQETWEDFCLSFTPAVREVVEFAKQIPGFRNLSPDDQVTLLKAGTFEVLMVRFASLFHLSDQAVTFISGATYSLEELRAMGMSDLLGAMFDFSHKLASLELSAQERSLFTAVVLVSAGRCGIQNVASVEQLQENLIRALRSLVSNNHQGDVDSPRFTKLLLKLADLRTLNNLHSDKLLAFRIHA